MTARKPGRLGVALLALVVLLVALVSVLEGLFTGLVTGARAVLVAFVVSRALFVVFGQARTPGEYVGGVGGLLYVLGLIFEGTGPQLGAAGQGYDFMLRSLGLGLAVLPLVLEYVPELAHLMNERLNYKKGSCEL